VKYRQSQAIDGKIKNITVKFVCGYWYVSVQTECAFETPILQGGELGVDMGVAHTITTDQGEHFDLPTSIEKLQARIAKLQKQLKNKIKGSNNRRKLIQKIAKEHHRIACIRQDFLHKVSTQLSKNHAMIFVEDLNIKGMTKSAAGTIEAPGKNVKAKSGLNRSILNQGWGEFLRQLDYKLLWNGGYLVKVNPAYTSQTCPRCGYVSRNNRRTQSDFVCVECGFADNADIVGAMNIKRAGHARLACEVNDISRQQQEPTEVTQLLLQ
jgi:putative transposase